MNDFEINEVSIQAVIRHYEKTDPSKADRDYAIQFLEAMQAYAQEEVKNGNPSPELTNEVYKELEQKMKDSEGQDV